MSTPPLPTTRRTVLASTGALAPAALGALRDPSAAGQSPGWSTYFRHGVASGDPLPHGAVIWTRVTPTSAATPGSGTGPRVSVTWQVATDAAFTRVVARGRSATGPWRDHTVKVDVGGLRPARWYHYRFSFGGRWSRTGRFRTAPATRATPRNLRLGLVSCSNLPMGWFNAYAHAAARDDVDLWLHVGDYVYEYGLGSYAVDDRIAERAVLPAHDHEMVALADYRLRFACYRADPH